MAGIPYVGMDAMATGSVDTDMSGVSLTTGDWVYMWSEQDKKGTKMNIKKLEALAPEDEEAEEPATWDETVADWEDNEVQYNCEDKDLSDDLFSPPDDVEFSDLTDFLLGIGDMAQQLGGQMPAGEGLDLDALEQQAKELQEKYGIEE